MSNTPDPPDTIEEILALAQRITDRYPKLAPALADLLDASDECNEPIDTDEARACFRFHAKHPALAEALMHLAQHAREQGLQMLPIKPVEDNNDWAEEPTIPK